MAAASAEPHPSSPARPPSLSPGPKLLPRDKQTRRQGRPPPPLPLPPPRSPPTPRPGPVRAPASESRCQSQPQPARARARGAGAGSRGCPPSPGAGHFRASPDLPPGSGGSRGRPRRARLPAPLPGGGGPGPWPAGTRSGQPTPALPFPKKRAGDASSLAWLTRVGRGRQRRFCARFPRTARAGQPQSRAQDRRNGGNEHGRMRSQRERQCSVSAGWFPLGGEGLHLGVPGVGRGSPPRSRAPPEAGRR